MGYESNGAPPLQDYIKGGGGGTLFIEREQ